MISISGFGKGRRCDDNRSIFRLESKVDQLEVSVVVLRANVLEISHEKVSRKTQVG